MGFLFAIPAAILAALANKNDLGMHSGLIDDGGMALIQRGVMTGHAKPIDRDLHVTGMALGSAALLDWLATRADVSFRGADHTHEVGVIRQIPNFVSINSAVEIVYKEGSYASVAVRSRRGTTRRA